MGWLPLVVISLISSQKKKNMVMLKGRIWPSIFLVSITTVVGVAGRTLLSREEDEEIERQLKVLNKLALKTIKVVFKATVVGVAGRKLLSREEDEEIERQLKVLNKLALKTIKILQTEHGDIIDCVDIYKQPSLDHPILKNLTIQMEPGSSPEEFETSRSSSIIITI
ncbi:uncharacterized protein LOC123198321 isoform X1 [Mangifera indica]|uniref:uncharacterized protein LOC123198321 isoform X1 n=1 Tax=Mangifera indica TaxID=29780 RepID=UPI001CFC25DA|nr:uncharacterized protein LOC123198321 isoform X1 [Mangifera indica]